MTLNSFTAPKEHFQKKLVRGIAVIAGISTIGVALSLFSYNAEAMKQYTTPGERFTMELRVPQPSDNFHVAELLQEKPADQFVKVRNGDTLSSVFARAGLDAQDIQEVMGLGKDGKRLTNLVPGQKFEIELDEDQDIQRLVFHISERNWITVARNESKQLIIKPESRDYERRTAFAKGTIKSSLFEAAQQASISESIAMDLAYIFGWDVDFALDIRENDSFVVMYEELFLDGEKVRDGDILAAEFTNQGHSYKAIRYTDDQGRTGYYTPNGQSMKKAFLRTPVDFSRISSRYGNRKHPTLKSWKKHTGVDYAAPRGTPIKASGDGKIIYRGTKGGYGNTVIVDHGNGYRTLYAHLNNYNRKARSGKSVKQGQVLGYVGSTGRATGPHLHYEFQVDGSHRNPLTVRLPNAAPIAKEYRTDFISKTQPLLAQIDFIKSVGVALSSI